MTERDDKIRDARVRGLRVGNAVMLDRTQPFMGTCQVAICGRHADLRPYGNGGLWICQRCAEKDPKTTKARMAHVLFGEALPDGV